MPELVYNVRFQIDTTSVEKIKDPISDSAKSSMEAYQNEIAELQGKIETLSGVTKRSGNSSKKAAEDTQKLAQSQNQASNSGNKLKNTFFNQMANVNKLTAELVSTRAEFQRLASTQNLSAEATEKFKQDVLSLSSAVDEESRKLRELGSATKLTDNQQAAMFRTITGGENAIRTARSQLESYEVAMKRSTQTVDAATQKFLEEQGAVQRSTSELRQKVTALEKLVASGNASNEALERMSNEIMEFAISAERSGAELQEMAGKLDLTDGQAKQLATTLSSLNRAQVLASRRTGAVNQQLTGMANAVAGTNRQAGLMNKQFAGANQTLFSFSDLVQDSAQFSYGFASGMRAIGNNIGFTAELIAVTAANVQKYNAEVEAGNIAGAKKVTVLGALRQSLTGVGGIVLGINLAVTALTVLSKGFGSTSKSAGEAESAIKSFGSAASGLRDIGGQDFLGVRALERQISVLENSVSLFEQASEAAQEFADLRRIAQTGVSAQVRFGVDLATQEDVSKALQKLQEQYGTFVDETGKLLISQEQLENRLKAVREELAINELFFELDPLAQFRDSISKTSTKLGILNDAGRDVSDQIRTQIKLLKEQRDALILAGEGTEDFYAKLFIFNVAIRQYEGFLNNSTDATKDFSDEVDRAAAKLTELSVLRFQGQDVADATRLVQDYQFLVASIEADMVDATAEQTKQLKELLDIQGFIFSEQAQLLATDIVGAFAPDTAKDRLQELKDSLKSSTDALKELRGQFDSDSQEYAFIQGQIELLQKYGVEQEGIIRNQKLLNELQAASTFVNAIGQLGEVFEASKEFQYAMAVVAGSLGIINAFSDPNPALTTLQRFANAAAVAAAVAVQIKQIKDTNIGSTSSFQQPSSSFGAGSSITEATPPQQNISFAPTAQSDGMTLNITNEVVATPKGLAIITRNGEREIANSQKSVR